MSKEPDHERVRQIGDLGENLFERLCIKARFNKSRPGYDSMGWDFFVEIPVKDAPYVYADARPSVTRVLVQVKATDNFDGSLDTITVRNHEHLAKAKMPAFVFLVEFSGEDEPQRAFLCHYDAPRIGATLRRMRELEAQGKRDFNNHRMVLRPTKDEAFDLSNPRSLMAMFFNVIGPDEQAYLDRKKELVDTLGREKGDHRFSFATRVSLNDMTEAMLGYKPLEIEHGRFSDIRFDIELGVKDVGSGVIKVEPRSAGPCIITVDRGKQKPQLRMSAEIFFASIPGVEEETFSGRVSGCVTDILLRAGTCKVRFDVDFEKEYKVADLLKEVDFWLSLKQKGVKIAIHKDGTLIGKSVIDRTIKPHRNLERLARELRLITRILKDFDLPLDFSISLNRLDDSLEALFWLRLAVERRGTTFNGELSPMDALLIDGRKGIYYLPVVLKSSNRVLVVFPHWSTQVSAQGSEISAKLTRGTIWDAILLDADVPDDLVRERWASFKEFCRVGTNEVTIQRELMFADYKMDDVPMSPALREIMTLPDEANKEPDVIGTDS